LYFAVNLLPNYVNRYRGLIADIDAIVEATRAPF